MSKPEQHNWNQALLQAAMHGDWHELKRAIKAGADVNTCDETGVTVLMYAVRRGDDLEMVKYLVEHGADVRARDRAGRTALDYLTFPEEPPEKWENAHEAWTHSEENYIEAYLERIGGTRGNPAKPVQVTVAQPIPQTPEASAQPTEIPRTGKQKQTASGLDWMLFAAIQHGSLADVESILATDQVNINARDEGDYTPLMRAVAANQVEITRALLNSGADPTAHDKKGRTALSIASPEAKAALGKFLR